MPGAKCPSCQRIITRLNRQTGRLRDEEGGEDNVAIYVCPTVGCGVILGVAPHPDEVLQDVIDRIRGVLKS